VEYSLKSHAIAKFIAWVSLNGRLTKVLFWCDILEIIAADSRSRQLQALLDDYFTRKINEIGKN
jgi:hypothetical protein